MEAPRIDPILRACDAFGLQLDRDDTSFFYADPKIEAAEHGMPDWRRQLFAALQRNARPLPDDLRIKAERRIELGVTVSI
jgi:K+ transporter